MNLTVIGMDIAKHVFQLHAVSPVTGETERVKLKRNPAPRVLCEARTFLGGVGSLWRRTPLGQATTGAWSRRQADLRTLSPTIRVAQQERCHRRPRDMNCCPAT